MFIPITLSRRSAEGRRRSSTNCFLDFIFKQQFQALHKKIWTTTACALLNITHQFPANDTTLRHLREAELEIMTLKW